MLLAAAVFISELAVMFLLPRILPKGRGAMVADLLDATLLVLAAGLVFHPVLTRFDQRAQRAEQDLQAQRGAAQAASADLLDLKAALDEHAIVAITDAAGTILEVNDRFCAISQYSRAELIGKTHRLINSGVHPRAFWADLWRMISGGHAWHGEVCNRAKDGSLYWVDSTIVPIRDATGRITRHVTIRADITSRKAAERRVHESEQLLRTVLDLLPQRVFWKDRDGRYLGANAGLLEDAGMAEVVGKTDFDMPWKPEEAAFYRACDARVMDSGQPELDITETQRTASGGEIILHTNKVPLRDANGRVFGVLGTYQDVTAFKRAERQLATERAQLDAFVEHAPVAIAMFDREMRYLVASRRWATDFGVGGTTLTGRCHYDVFPNLSEEWKAAHRRALAGVVVGNEDDRWRPPGWDHDQHLRWEVRPWHEPSGAVGGIIILAQDMSEQRQREQELARLRDAAEAASQAKSEFVANMSHEIRTPLTAILGYAELLKEGNDTAGSAAARGELIGTIRHAGEHLLGLVNDLLDLSRIESGQLATEEADVDLPGLLTAVASLLRPQAAAKGITLQLQVATPVPRTIRSDPTRLRQILLSVAGNAVKFTEQGGVDLQVAVAGTELQVDVVDTGTGMSASAAEHLFAPFAQVDGSVTRRHGGCGLGLALSRRLAVLLGGDVALVESTPGKGSRFRIRLPLVAHRDTEWVTRLDGVQPARAPSRGVTLRGRILVAEDGLDNQRLLVLYLSKAGAEVDVAENGRIALDMIERTGCGEPAGPAPYDLLVTDMQMPEMDGYTLAQTLRARGLGLPIIALTAHAMTEDRQRCLDAGCDDYTTKPVDRHRLLALCASWLGRRRVPTSDPEPARAAR